MTISGINPIIGSAASLRTAAQPWGFGQSSTTTTDKDAKKAADGQAAGGPQTTSDGSGAAAAPVLPQQRLLPTEKVPGQQDVPVLKGPTLLPTTAAEQAAAAKAAGVEPTSSSAIALAASATAEFQRGMDTMRAALDVTSRTSRLLGSPA